MLPIYPAPPVTRIFTGPASRHDRRSGRRLEGVKGRLAETQVGEARPYSVWQDAGSLTIDQGNRRSTEAGAGQPSAQRTRLLRLLDEHVQLRGRNLEVVTERAM